METSFELFLPCYILKFMGRHISSYRELLFSKVECIAFYVKNEPAKNIELTPSPTVRREN